MSEKKYKCDKCVKSYTTYQTLWVHNKKFHNNIKTDTNIDNNKSTASFACRICGKCYKHAQSRHTHEKSCSGVPPINVGLELEKAKQETEKLKNDTEKLKIEAEKTKQETVKLEIRLQEMQIEDDDTVRSINKLMDNAHVAINSNNNNNNNNVVNNNITNNINITFPSILGYGAETHHINVVGTLTEQDKDAIINSARSALDKIVEIVHFGEYDFFKNVIITNLTKKYAYKYDDSVKNFTKVDKTLLLDDLYEKRTTDLETIYDDFVEQKKLSNRTRIDFKKYLGDLDNKEDLFYDFDKKKYKNYKTYKLNVINELLYNNRHKIMDDIKAIIQDWGDRTKIEN